MRGGAAFGRHAASLGDDRLRHMQTLPNERLSAGDGEANQGFETGGGGGGEKIHVAS